MKRELILLKLGGAVITNKKKPYTPKKETIKRLAKEIKEARKKKKFDLILGHGSGSFAHTSAKLYKTKEGFINKESLYGFCLVQRDASALNKIVTDIFLKTGLKVFSLQPSAFILTRGSKIISFNLKIILKLLEYEIIPIIYGDVVVDLKKGCAILSTEDLLSYLAIKLKPKRILFGSREEGVYIKDKKGRKVFLKKVDRENWREIKKYLFSSEGIDVTGGMLHKVEKSIELAKRGFRVEIFSETKKGNLKKVLLGKKIGTEIKW